MLGGATRRREPSTHLEVPLDEVPALLAERFGIKGVALREDGRFGID